MNVPRRLDWATGGVIVLGGVAEAFLDFEPNLEVVGPSHRSLAPQAGMLLFPLAAGYLAGRGRGRPVFVAGLVGAVISPLALGWFFLANNDWSSDFVHWSLVRIGLQLPVAVLGGMLSMISRRPAELSPSIPAE